MGFGFGPKSAVYHYHSNYDSFDWMEKYGDPGFHYHATIAKVWGLLAANLIESPIIPFDARQYAHGLTKYVYSVKEKAKKEKFLDDEEDQLWVGIDLAMERFRFATRAHDAVAAALNQQLDDNDIPWW